MDLLDAVLILAAGTAAGTINAAVGSGSLITFPTLLALGVPAVTANVSNNIGLVPGGLAAMWGFRAELAARRRRLLLLGSVSALGGAGGAVLLILLPETAFRSVVPVLIAVAVVLVAPQPWIQRRLADRRGNREARADPDGPAPGDPAPARPSPAGPEVGGSPAERPAERGESAGVGPAGMLVAALVGARIGRRLPQPVLRGCIVVVGLVAILVLLRSRTDTSAPE